MAHRCCLGKLPLGDDDRACTALIRLRRRTGSPPGPVAGAVEVNWQRNATTSPSAGAKGREAAAQVAARRCCGQPHTVYVNCFVGVDHRSQRNVSESAVLSSPVVTPGQLADTHVMHVALAPPEGSLSRS